MILSGRNVRVRWWLMIFGWNDEIVRKMDSEGLILV